MDPESALVMARTHLDDDKLPEALRCLNSYHRWRRREGYEPHEGDKRYYEMLVELKRKGKSNVGSA